VREGHTDKYIRPNETTRPTGAAQKALIDRNDWKMRSESTAIRFTMFPLEYAWRADVLSLNTLRYTRLLHAALETRPAQSAL